MSRLTVTRRGPGTAFTDTIQLPPSNKRVSVLEQDIRAKFGQGALDYLDANEVICLHVDRIGMLASSKLLSEYNLTTADIIYVRKCIGILTFRSLLTLVRLRLVIENDKAIKIFYTDGSFAPKPVYILTSDTIAMVKTRIQQSGNTLAPNSYRLSPKGGNNTNMYDDNALVSSPAVNLKDGEEVKIGMSFAEFVHRFVT